MQFLVVQRTVRVCVEQLEDLSCPPLVLLHFVSAEQPNAERSELFVVEGSMNFNTESRQYRYRKRPRITIHRLRHVQRVVSRVAIACLRRHDDRTTVTPILVTDCYLFRL